MKRIALFLTIALAACQAAPQEPSVGVPVEAQAPVLSPLLRNAVSVEGRPLKAQLYGDSGKVVLFLATIHGDESAGTKLLVELAKRLDQDPTLRGDYRVLLVPVVNPDGMAKGTRRNAHNVDLNRNFPARNFQASLYRGHTPLSEPESKFISDLVRTYKPVRILSFHQAANRIDYDGPGAALAHRLASLSPLAVQRMGQRPGSLGAWAGGDRQIPTLTIELPRSADDLEPDQAWEAYGMLLTQSLVR